MDKQSAQIKPVGDRRVQTEGQKDWLPVDVIAAIWRKKSSLTRLSRLHGYKSCGLKLALRTPWPKAERIIAEFIGEPPQTIWPSRYHADGTSNRAPRGNPNWVSRPHHQTHATRRTSLGHVKKAVAN